jgi:trimeric autotransporter adhesin
MSRRFLAAAALLAVVPAGSVVAPEPATLLKDIRTVIDYTPGFQPASLTRAGPYVFFTDTLQEQLWRTDGSAAGTVLVKELSQVSGLRKVGSALFFHASDGTHGIEPWMSDGTPEGTFMVKDIAPGAVGSSPSAAHDHNGVAYFSVTSGGNGNGALWKSDGTAAGTVLLKDFAALGSDVISGAVSSFYMSVGDTLYFGAQTGAEGPELWKTDGTAAGTVLVADLAPGTGGSTPIPMYAWGGLLYFSAVVGNTPGLYVTDGSAAGTQLVTTAVNPRVGNNCAVDGTGTFFFSGASASGQGLWRTDGTAAGTVLVKDFNPASNDIFFYGVGPCLLLDGVLYMGVDDGSHGNELWKSDGTEAGTVLVKDINSGGTGFGYASPYGFAALNGLLYFAVADDGDGPALWRSDGSAAGTVEVFDSMEDLGHAVVLGNRLLFSNGDPEHGRELWGSDGTTAGTSLLRDLGFRSGSEPGAAVYVNGLAFFAAEDGVAGRELWKTDGTAAGTVMVKDIATGAGSSAPAWLMPLGNTLYFAATDASGDRELWRSDGTAAGTVPSAARCTSPRTTASTAPSCGRATARKAARSC